MDLDLLFALGFSSLHARGPVPTDRTVACAFLFRAQRCFSFAGLTSDRRLRKHGWQ